MKLWDLGTKEFKTKENHDGFWRIVLPANVSVQGLIPAKRLEVPKSEIFKTPL